jgi:hypothetical protein
MCAAQAKAVQRNVLSDGSGRQVFFLRKILLKRTLIPTKGQIREQQIATVLGLWDFVHRG